MARNKDKKKKEHLTHALVKNERAPIWVYMKTKSRELIRGRKRSWRFDKLGKRVKQMDKKSDEYRGRSNPVKKISNKRTRKRSAKSIKNVKK